MKIVSWNVNSIRARLDQALDWLERERPDVALLQETKIVDQEFPIDDFGDLGYDAVFHGQRSYNGVAILARDELEDVTKGLPGDGPDEDRRLISAVAGGIRFISVYVPNGQAVGAEQFAYKLEFLARLKAHLAALGSPDRPLVIAGDYNIAPRDIDVWDPKAMAGSTHVSPPERAALEALMGWGLYDAFRAKNPDQRQFSWWDYRAGAFNRDAGLRIDLHLVTKPILDQTTRVWVDVEARAADKASDHAPVVLEVDTRRSTK